MKKRPISAIVFLLCALLMTSACSTIAIRTAIEIDAPQEEVYAVLSDLESYPQWNPYHRKVVGDFREGADLRIHVLRPDNKRVVIPPHMLKISENREITWGGGIRGIFYGEHSFILENQAGNKTLLKHNEDFSGIVIGFADLPPDTIAAGYQEMNIALKALIEGRERPLASTEE